MKQYSMMATGQGLKWATMRGSMLVFQMDGQQSANYAAFDDVALVSRAIKTRRAQRSRSGRI